MNESVLGIPQVPVERRSGLPKGGSSRLRRVIFAVLGMHLADAKSARCVSGMRYGR